MYKSTYDTVCYVENSTPYSTLTNNYSYSGCEKWAINWNEASEQMLRKYYA